MTKSISSKFFGKYFILLITCNFLFHFFGYSQSNLKSIDSVAQFVNSNYNMGKITFGKPVQYNVIVKNISIDTFSIATVTVGCGCTTPTYNAGQILKPGQSASISLGFNGSSLGAFTKFATIFFGNGMSKQVQFNGESIKQ